MRQVFFGFLLTLSTWMLAAQSASVPQVPSSIEIAGMKLKITDEARKEIQKDVNALRASDKYFKIKLDRVNLYFPIIERVFKEEGVPDDLKFLSVQESALISDAVSSSDAVGYWQFKDFTALEVGLRVDNKVDERKNIVAASRGAAKYFKRNNMFFSNWMYAVNAYMTGPGGAQRYVDKDNFGKDKMVIDKKTHWYVLRFIAHVIAFRDEIGAEQSEGLKLVEYTRGANKHLDEIARQFNVDENLVRDYNKWLKHGKIPDDKVYSVIIPVTGKVPRIKEENVVAAPREEVPQENVRYPTVLTGEIINHQAMKIEINGKDAVIAAPGDDLTTLSVKTGIPGDRLARFNDLKPTATLQAGQIYYLQNKRNRSPIRFHVVQYGETLWGISQKYGVKLKRIYKMNRVSASDPLKAGRLIWLRKKRSKDEPVKYYNVPKPVKKAPEKVIVKETPPVEQPVKEKADTERPVGSTPPVLNEPLQKVVLFKYHPVSDTETLSMIASYYEVTLNQLLEWNEMSGPENLKTGMNLRIKTTKEIQPVTQAKDGNQPTENMKEDSEVTTDEAKYHVVQAGESLWSISQRYGLTVEQLKQGNNLADGAISIGQQLKVNVSINAAEEDKAEEPEETEKSEEESLVTFIVNRGNTLFQIAQQFNMSVEELIKINELDSTNLFIGQELKVIQK